MKKTGMLFLALVLALGSLGVGYALWEKSVYIDAVVNTGEVDAIMSEGNCYDSEPTNKDYSSIACSLNTTDNQRLDVTLTDAYPSVNYTCEFDITNTGTVPIIVQSVTGLPTPPWAEIYFSKRPGGGSFVGTQIDPGWSENGTMMVHLNNNAEELTTYKFSVAIQCVQWNEYIP
jgi:hypothetical protein